jgi:hypothetical protein
VTHSELGQAMYNQGAGVWSAERWTVYWGLPPEEQAAMAQIAQDSPDPPGISGWTTALGVASMLVTVAGDIAGLGTGVTAIEAVVKALKAA